MGFHMGEPVILPFVMVMEIQISALHKNLYAALQQELLKFIALAHHLSLPLMREVA